MNPFVKAEPEVSLPEEEVDVTSAANPGEDYVAALEAEAAETEAAGQLQLSAADDIVGAYPYAFDDQQQQYQQYYEYYGAQEGEGQQGQFGY